MATDNSFNKIVQGYLGFRDKYATGDNSIMELLAYHGQQPNIMIVACCDSRVDPALILQCDPGDLFIVRNVANIIPPYEDDAGHHGTSAALEFAICYLNIKHLIILGHSQCGGIHALLNSDDLKQNDFISQWVSILDSAAHSHTDTDTCARESLSISYNNCLTFPWIKERLQQGELFIHRWFFDIKEGQIHTYSSDSKQYEMLTSSTVL